MVFDPAQFSETVRTLSSTRFRHFLGVAFDLESGYCAENDPDADGDVTTEFMTKNETFGPDPRFSWLEYTRTERAALGYQYESSRTRFLIVHHAPRLIASLDYLEVLRSDVTELRKLRGTSRSSFHYITNKNIGHWRMDLDAFRREGADILQNADISISCIDPYDLGTKLHEYPEMESALLQVLRSPDGVAIEISDGGLQVRPFLSSDVLRTRDNNSGWVLNVDATPLVGEGFSSLEGLRDVLTLEPYERTINAFLMDHVDLTLFRGRYVDVRTEIALAPSGKTPDFFLQNVDGLWDVLELKRPLPMENLIARDKSGMINPGRYLSDALIQCQAYLHLLDSREVRDRLYTAHHIRIDRPTITLLIGKNQYPPGFKDSVEVLFDHRIALVSFEDLLEECTILTAKLVQEMAKLAQRQGSKMQMPL